MVAAVESAAGFKGSNLSSGFGSAGQRDPGTTNQTPTATTTALGFAFPALHAGVTTMASAAGAPSQPLDVQALAEQMIAGMHMRTAADGSSQMRLSLVPEHLGEVAVRLTVSGTSVTANVTAQSADARSALLANHQELARSLADSGLKLTGFSVDVSGGQQQDRNGSGSPSGFGRRFTIHELNAPAETPPEALATANTGMLSPQGLALYNYLA